MSGRGYLDALTIDYDGIFSDSAVEGGAENRLSLAGLVHLGGPPRCGVRHHGVAGDRLRPRHDQEGFAFAAFAGKAVTGRDSSQGRGRM
jgi:hypothetical protein